MIDPENLRKSFHNPYAKTREEAVAAFRAALLKVATPYFRSMLPNDQVAHGERVFAYELYHQMRLTFNGAWYVNGEFRKGMRVVPEICSDAVMIPDLVVHQPDSLEENLLAVEIKAAPRLRTDHLIMDAEKLDFYTRPTHHKPAGLGFALGIMLIVNADFSAFYKSLPTDKAKRLRSAFGRFGQVAIWNIAQPVANKNDSAGSLEPTCLKILRTSWNGWDR